MSLTPEAAYAELIRRSKELGVLSSCSAVLGWDEQTYMPPGGSAHRGEQMALLAGLHHERATDPRLGELLGGRRGLRPGRRTRIRRRRSNVRETPPRPTTAGPGCPAALVEELARTTSLAQQEWVAARQRRGLRPLPRPGSRRSSG